MQIARVLDRTQFLRMYRRASFASVFIERMLEGSFWDTALHGHPMHCIPNAYVDTTCSTDTAERAQPCFSACWLTSSVWPQVQMRDLNGFVETRQTLLHQKPGARGNWISFAVAHHLTG